MAGQRGRLQRGEDDMLHNSIRHLNMYDSAPLASTATTASSGFELATQISVRLFGNANIGWLDRSNMQIPGQFGGDCGAVIMRWYARTNVPTEHPSYPDFMRWAKHTHATMVIGDRPEWHLTLDELLARRPVVVPDEGGAPAPASWVDPWPAVIPPRHNFSVVLDQFSQADLQRIARHQWHDTWQGSAPPLVWVHFEGIRGEFDGALEQACAQIAQRTHERKSFEESVASWIMGRADAITDGSDKAALIALADGVRSGLHNG